jgi:hypothetical protein
MVDFEKNREKVPLMRLNVVFAAHSKILHIMTI